MELKKRREISINQYLFLFLLQSFLALVAAMFLWFGTIMLLISTNQMVPADAAENAVDAWAAGLKADDVVMGEDLPETAGYAIFEKAGNGEESNLSGEAFKKAEAFGRADKEIRQTEFAGMIYVRSETDTQVIILTYRIGAYFQNETLRKLFPHLETGLILYFMLLMLLALIFVCVLRGRKIKKKMQIMKDAAVEIGKQNLDFQMKNTGIKEFNQVMTALMELKAELEETLNRNWKLEQEKREQMSALAHDIKTPLTIVKGNAELLQETALDERQQENLSFITENADQIEQYVARMIEASKMMNVGRKEKGTKVVFERTEINLPSFLEQIRRNAEHLGRAKSLCIRLKLEELPEKVLLPEESLKRVLWNLLDNAVQYSPENGIICLYAGCVEGGAAEADAEKTEAEGEDVKVENAGTGVENIENGGQDNCGEEKLRLIFRVTDEGPGFSGEDLQSAADEFYRADKSRSSREHFGMGLFIAKQLVEEMGGKLLLGNGEQGGAEVKIILKQYF
ncbi:MAG: HAMP domain-containing sensor histidine kinase [Lachnospiraceae bacterium]|nr:HAMP domain-containing sensor histidine kinase [Lachnospiraceae bacterium]